MNEKDLFNHIIDGSKPLDMSKSDLITHYCNLKPNTKQALPFNEYVKAYFIYRSNHKNKGVIVDKSFLESELERINNK